MNCQHCGAALESTASFCPNCGATVAQPNPYTQGQYSQPQYSQPQYSQPQYSQPQYSQPQYSQPQYSQPQAPTYGAPTYNTPSYTAAPQAPALSMGWFKFLIYFGLWAGAIGNLINGIMQMTGIIYGDELEKALVYAVFDGLESLDMIVGALMIALAVLGIVARFRLAGYCANGPKLLNAVYIGVAIVNVIYLIGLATVLPEGAFETLDTASFISSTCVSVAMVAVNTKYFANRKAMFNK